MTRGGARPGAGRKTKAVKHERQINKAEKRCADRLPETIGNLEALADGGYPRVKEKWEPAALVVLELPLRDALGNPMLDADGKPILAKQQVFPHAKPDELVLVERITEIADRDRAANIYLTDRAMGKPVQKQELTGKDGEALAVIAIDVIQPTLPDDGA